MALLLSVQVGGGHTAVVTEEGALYTFGAGAEGQVFACGYWCASFQHRCEIPLLALSQSVHACLL